MPAHFDTEVYSGLRRLDRRGEIDPGILDEMVRALVRLRATRIPIARLLMRAHVLGARFSPPDSLYVALAQRLDVDLLTHDAPLARACEGIVRAQLV